MLLNNVSEHVSYSYHSNPLLLPFSKFFTEENNGFDCTFEAAKTFDSVVYPAKINYGLHLC